MNNEINVRLELSDGEANMLWNILDGVLDAGPEGGLEFEEKVIVEKILNSISHQQAMKK